MGKAVVISPTLASVGGTFRDPDDRSRPRLRYACVVEYRAWVHVIPLGVRMVDPIPLRDVRNVLCRALMEMGADIRAAETEAKAAVRKSQAFLVVNGVRHTGAGVEGRRFRAVTVDIGDTRVVAVVPATQRNICLELSDV